MVLLEAGRSGPGLQLVAAQMFRPGDLAESTPEDNPPTTGFPKTIRPGKSFSLRLFYMVTDCRAVPAGLWPVPVRVRQWWGELAVDLRPEPQTADDHPSYYTTHNGRGAYSVEWQKYMADHVCAPPKKKRKKTS
ncbi:hypothetical protein ACOZ38_01525 [Sphaerisporangium viridialbum]|uniref:hypothetical protein n=1 Tax=Sphaerisporangium viridialbum TaxID=46189 RepID=UPI003C780FBA